MKTAFKKCPCLCVFSSGYSTSSFWQSSFCCVSLPRSVLVSVWGNKAVPISVQEIHDVSSQPRGEHSGWAHCREPRPTNWRTHPLTTQNSPWSMHTHTDTHTLSGSLKWILLLSCPLHLSLSNSSLPQQTPLKLLVVRLPTRACTNTCRGQSINHKNK